MRGLVKVAIVGALGIGALQMCTSQSFIGWLDGTAKSLRAEADATNACIADRERLKQRNDQHSAELRAGQQLPPPKARVELARLKPIHDQLMAEVDSFTRRCN